MISDSWYNWWASYQQIVTSGAACPLSPEGQRQAAAAVLDSTQWHDAFLLAFLGTIGLTLVAVLWTYETDKMGHDFRNRWFKALFVTAPLVAAAVYIGLALSAINTVGCESGNSATHIPAAYSLSRASVALVQALLFFNLFSWLLARTAKVWKRRRWVNNAHNPYSRR